MAMSAYGDQQIIDRHFRGETKEVLVPAIFQVLTELESYWPLTLRQVYYRLVAAQVIENHINRYKALSRVLATLRRMEVVPWSAIEDRTRRVSDKRGWESKEDFVRDELDDLLKGYARCLVQNQENYVEIFVEKDALATIFEDMAWPYCVRVVTCKGHPSATFVQAYAKRAELAIGKGQKPVILYYGDLDPTGARIPVAIGNNLWNHHDVDVDMHVIALTTDQVKNFELPHSIEALKTEDPNYKWFVRNFGEIAVELDALHPGFLEDLIKHGLQQVLDIEDMLEQQKIEQRECKKLEKAKKLILEMIKKEKLI